MAPHVQTIYYYVTNLLSIGSWTRPQAASPSINMKLRMVNNVGDVSQIAKFG